MTKKGDRRGKATNQKKIIEDNEKDLKDNETTLKDVKINTVRTSINELFCKNNTFEILEMV